MRCTRAWKLFFLLPRMLLFRSVRRGLVPGPSWRRGSDNSSLAIGLHCCWRQLQFQRRLIPVRSGGEGGTPRTTRPSGSHGQRLGCNLGNCLQQGRLSTEVKWLQARWQRWQSSPTQRRPRVPRQPNNEDIMRMVPGEQFQLDPDEFLIGLRKARRGATSGPSGMTSDHLFPILESEFGSLGPGWGVVVDWERVRVHSEGIRLGRITALCKPDEGVRGIVVGDILRRFVAKTMAKLVSKEAEAATAPFQYALSTKAGCECVAHILQSITDLDPEATVISMDGIGAYDLISRNAMLGGLLRMEKGDQILPFVRCFYGTPSTYLWDDEMGVTQHIHQGERGEQGDPLMLMLFALGRHPALAAPQERLRGNELLFTY